MSCARQDNSCVQKGRTDRPSSGMSSRTVNILSFSISVSHGRLDNWFFCRGETVQGAATIVPVCPVMARGKLLLQDLGKMYNLWDTPLLATVYYCWPLIPQSLMLLASLHIPQVIIQLRCSFKHIQTVTFSASYATAILRTETAIAKPVQWCWDIG